MGPIGVIIWGAIGGGIDGAIGADIPWSIFDVPPWYPKLFIRYSFMESIFRFISKIKSSFFFISFSFFFISFWNDLDKVDLSLLKSNMDPRWGMLKTRKKIYALSSIIIELRKYKINQTPQLYQIRNAKLFPLFLIHVHIYHGRSRHG